MSETITNPIYVDIKNDESYKCCDIKPLLGLLLINAFMVGIMLLVFKVSGKL